MEGKSERIRSDEGFDLDGKDGCSSDQGSRSGQRGCSC